MLKIAAEIQKEKITPKTIDDLPGGIVKKINLHANKFGWMIRGGLDEPWTIRDVFDRIKDALKEDCKNKILVSEKHNKETQKKSTALLKELHADKELRRLVALSKELVYYRTYRTDYLNLTMFNIRTLLTEIGNRLGYSFYEIAYFREDELINLSKVNKKELEQRMNNFILISVVPNTVTFASLPTQIKEIEDKYVIKEEAKGGEIRGNSAFKGKVTRKVVKISSKKDLPKVNKGDIIVTIMKTPDYVSAMEKAAAFVTDEGGITCHAAIIAREMKKPCIIGTKNATQMLKEGDVVEVDANNGVVKILN